jgi:hypothetical protein
MLSKFPNKTLKIGAPVSLSPQSRFVAGREGNGPGRSNPVGVRGRVVEKDNSTVFVTWDTGARSVDYRVDDYDLICEGEPGFLEVE